MENSQSERILELLDLYLRDGCSKEDIVELILLLETPEGIKTAHTFLGREAVSLMQARLTLDRSVSDRIFDRLRESIGQQSSFDKRIAIPIYKRSFFRIAASVVGFVLFAGLLFFLMKPQPESIFVTQEGQKRTVVLEDGSLVTLNGNSSVSFKMDREKRLVFLDGEAYFDVAHDQSKPFFVRTSQLEIRVLGTVFNVKSYQHEDHIEATLVSGKVTVRNLGSKEGKPDEIELAPNEQVVYNKATSTLAKNRAEVKTNTSWRSGNLFFEDESAQTIFAELEKWYGVKITLENSQERCRFSMNIGEEGVEEVLGFFEKTTNVKIVGDGSGYRLEGKLCEE